MEGVLIMLIWALFRFFLPFAVLIVLGTVVSRQQRPHVHLG